MQTTTHTNHTGSQKSSRSMSLADLAELSSSDLDHMYRRGKCPASIDDVAGLPRGRMLAVRGLGRGTASRLIRRFAGSAGFPWGGKTFMSHGKNGEGVNRIHLGGRHTLFPFKLAIGPSVVDGSDAVILDYDLPDNPWVIRQIHDEVREVAPGLLMGPAMWKTKGKPSLVLWFALDLADPAAPIGETIAERRTRNRNGALA
ncbi:MAG: hypothetical protein ACRELY_00925 [Polyangiaceae bacterium]